MLGISKQEEAPSTPQRPLSPLGDACSRKDLTAIHQILVMTHYRDDEGTGTNEVNLTCTCAMFLLHDEELFDNAGKCLLFSCRSKNGLNK